MDTHLHQGQRNGGGGINDAATQAMPAAIGVKSPETIEAGAIVPAQSMDDQLNDLEEDSVFDARELGTNLAAAFAGMDHSEGRLS